MATLETYFEPEPIKPAGQSDRREDSRDPGENLKRGTVSPERKAGAERPRLPLLDIIDISQQADRREQKENGAQYIHRTKEERKKGRLCFMMNTGLTIHEGKRVRFLTLTSSTTAPKDMKASFDRLVQDIRRSTPNILSEKGYANKQAINAWVYDSLDGDDHLKLEYCGCRTAEGNGVIHVLTVGDFVPFKFIQDRWKAIHNSTQCNIRAVKKGQSGKAVGYLLTQYIAGQDAFIRGFCSKGWMYTGARKDFLDLIKRRKAEHKAAGIKDSEAWKLILVEWNKSLTLSYPSSSRLYHEDMKNYVDKCRKAHRKRITGRHRFVPDPIRPKPVKYIRVVKEYGEFPLPVPSLPL